MFLVGGGCKIATWGFYAPMLISALRILEHSHPYLQIILFYHFKNNFIYYTISFYNTLNILTFIFLYNTLK